MQRGHGMTETTQSNQVSTTAAAGFRFVPLLTLIVMLMVVWGPALLSSQAQDSAAATAERVVNGAADAAKAPATMQRFLQLHRSELSLLRLTRHYQGTMQRNPRLRTELQHRNNDSETAPI